jgi:hypothetical protein
MTDKPREEPTEHAPPHSKVENDIKPERPYSPEILRAWAERLEADQEVIRKARAERDLRARQARRPESRR